MNFFRSHSRFWHWKVAWAFSLLEVTLAMGLMMFCIGSLIGLISIGLSNQQSATEQTKAVLSLESVSTCIRQVSPDSQGICHVTLPAQDPLGFDFVSGGEPVSLSFGFTEAGTFCKAEDHGPNRRGTVHIKLTPPASDGEAGYASVSAAWLASATYEQGGWTHQLGSVETVVYFNFP